jgi:hypothetical protein
MSASTSNSSNSASDELKARLYTGAGGQSAQVLPGTRRASRGTSGPNNPNGFAGRTRGNRLVPRKTMRGSRSTPALGGLNSLGRTTAGRNTVQMAGMHVNNFLPGVSEKTDAPSSQKTDAPVLPASPSAAAASSAQAKTKAAGRAKKRRTDLTFTQMLNLDKATLREFLRGDFLYLKSNSDAVSVYDLHVVDHSEIESDLKSNSYFTYWTMSRAGLTQFFESPADAIGPGTST